MRLIPKLTELWQIADCDREKAVVGLACINSVAKYLHHSVHSVIIAIVHKHVRYERGEAAISQPFTQPGHQCATLPSGTGWPVHVRMIPVRRCRRRVVRQPSFPSVRNYELVQRIIDPTLHTAEVLTLKRLCWRPRFHTDLLARRQHQIAPIKSSKKTGADDQHAEPRITIAGLPGPFTQCQCLAEPQAPSA